MADFKDFVPMKIDRTESRRPREIITNTEWNELFNLLITQGDHNSEYLEALKQYLLTGDEAVLTHLQEQIDNLINVDADYRVELDTKLNIDDAADTYETLADASQHLVGVTFDEDTGVLTFIRNNGQEVSIDTALEKVATNWTFDPVSKMLVLTLADGSTQNVDLSAFIKPTEFTDSQSIVWSISGSTVSAAVSPDYLAYMLLAKNAAEAAKTSAQSAAFDADTAKVDARTAAAAAQISETNAGTYAQQAMQAASMLGPATDTNLGLVKVDNDTIKVDPDGTLRGASGNAHIEGMTEAEYNALTPAEQMDGSLRIITDGKTPKYAITADKVLYDADKNATVSDALTALNSNLTVKYDEASGYIQYKENGVWKNWKNVKAQTQTFWTNPDSTSGFNPRTISNPSIDLGDYKSVTVTMRYWVDRTETADFTIPIGTSELCIVSTVAGKACRRVTVNASGVTFDNGHEGSTESGTLYNVACVPVEIIANAD